MSENGGKMDPKWEPKSVQNLKKIEKGRSKNQCQKLVPKCRRPGINPGSTGVGFLPPGDLGGPVNIGLIQISFKNAMDLAGCGGFGFQKPTFSAQG